MTETTQHSIQELMAEISLTEKKLNDIKGLEYAVITELERPSIGFDAGTNKFSVEVARKRVQSKLDSYLALVDRLQILKTLRDKTNMETTFNCEGKEFTLYSAIMWKRSMHSKLTYLYQQILDSDRRATRQAVSTTSERSMTLDYSRNKKSDTPIEVIPLLNIEQAKKEMETLENIYSRLDATITRVNSTTMVNY